MTGLKDIFVGGHQKETNKKKLENNRFDLQPSW